MNDSDILQLWKTTLAPLDFALFIIRDDAPEDDMEGVRETLADIAEAGEATIMVIRESVFADFRKMALQDLVALHETVDKAIRERTITGIVGDT